MRRFTRVIVLLIIIALIGGGAYYLFARNARQGSGLMPASSDAAGKGYVAVFLSNDQVYFGQLSTSDGALVLTDVYYIRLNQSSGTNSSSTSSEDAQLSLVKLGDQIHGPVDEMRINQDQVLFIERLKDESTVVRAIVQEKENRANGNSSSNSNSASNASNSSSNNQD